MSDEKHVPLTRYGLYLLLAAWIAGVPAAAFAQQGEPAGEEDAAAGKDEMDDQEDREAFEEEIVVTSPGDAGDVSSYGAEILVDLEARFRFAEHYELAVGGENVFDTFPDDELDPVLQFLGVTGSLTSPFGFNGGHWYARLAVDF